MRVTLLLSDSAQVAGDKLYVLGGGWSFTGPQVGPMALAVLVQVDWHEANRPLPFVLELVDPDGAPVLLGEENQPVRVEGQVEVGRPPGHPEGTAINVPLALGFGSLPLEPGRRFVWRFEIAGQSQPDWQVAFNTRPA